jgi:hypothetical protein
MLFSVRVVTSDMNVGTNVCVNDMRASERTCERTCERMYVRVSVRVLTCEHTFVRTCVCEMLFGRSDYLCHTI